jgi:N-acetylneuraminate synthase
MEPHEFKLLVEEGNNAFNALGNPHWRMQDSEKESRRIRRSLYIVNDVKKGDLITNENLRAIRPGEGCSPKLLSSLLGKHFTNNYTVGTPMDPNFAID